MRVMNAQCLGSITGTSGRGGGGGFGQWRSVWREGGGGANAPWYPGNLLKNQAALLIVLAYY